MKSREKAVRPRAHFTPERGTAMAFRAHLIRYLAGRPGTLQLRRWLNSLRSKADILQAVDRVLETRA